MKVQIIRKIIYNLQIFMFIIFMMVVSLSLNGCNKISSKNADNIGNQSEKNNANFSDSDEIIQFSDCTFKKYVLKQMGKKPNEDVTYKEAVSLEKLVIDRNYRTELTIDYRDIYSSIQGALSIDIGDIKYFIGLKELIIENGPYDTILGLDGISSCTKLETLTINYQEFDPMPARQYGSNYILEILKPLKNLKKIESGCFMTKTLRKKLKEQHENIEIVYKETTHGNISTSNRDFFAEMDNFNSDNWPSGYFASSYEEMLAEETLYIHAKSQNDYENQLTEAKKRKEKIRYVYLLDYTKISEEAITVDAGKLTEFINLESLFIARCIPSYKNEKSIVVDNIEKLQSLQYLSTLGLSGVLTDYTQIENFKSIDTLSIDLNGYLDGNVYLDNMNNLKKVAAYGNYIHLPESIEFLSVLTEKNMIKGENLKALNIKSKTNKFNMSFMKKLKYLEMYYDANENIDLNMIKDLSELEYLCINGGKVTYGEENIANLKKLVSFSLHISENRLEYVSGINELEMLSYMSIGAYNYENHLDVLLKLPDIKQLYIRDIIIEGVDNYEELGGDTENEFIKFKTKLGLQ